MEKDTFFAVWGIIRQIRIQTPIRRIQAPVWTNCSKSLAVDFEVSSIRSCVSIPSKKAIEGSINCFRHYY